MFSPRHFPTSGMERQYLQLPKPMGRVESNNRSVHHEVNLLTLDPSDPKIISWAHGHTDIPPQVNSLACLWPPVSKRTAGLAALFLKYLWALVASINGNLFILGPWAIHISIVLGVHFQLRHPSLELRKDESLAPVLAVFVLPGFHHLQGRFRPSWAETHPRSFNDLWKGRPEISWWKV